MMYSQLTVISVIIRKFHQYQIKIINMIIFKTLYFIARIFTYKTSCNNPAEFNAARS